MKIIMLIGYPFSLLYGFITAVRNFCFDQKILRSQSFPVPIINIGNLSMGGTGKTPHVEYMVRLLMSKYRIVTLSRGYKRKTEGFILASSHSTSVEIGDEPKQYKTKFNDIQVAVCEDRCKGVTEILKLYPDTGCVILDDAFQHRAIKPGFNVLLTDYNHLFTRDRVLPAGTLREFRRGYKRANIIVVTKCPDNLALEERQRIINEIRPKPYQQVFFSYIAYGAIVPLDPGTVAVAHEKPRSALLFSGIAKTDPLERYLSGDGYTLHALHFADHHQYSLQDLMQIKEAYHAMASEKKIIITTEKDAMRIETDEQKNVLKGLPVFYIPIEVKFYDDDKKIVDKLILNYVADAGKN